MPTVDMLVQISGGRARCAAPTLNTLEENEMTFDPKWLSLGASSLVLACSPQAGTAPGDSTAAITKPAIEPIETTAPEPVARAAPASAGKVALSGSADAEAMRQTGTAAAGQQMTKIQVTPSQSFGLSVDGQRIASIVTGQASFTTGTPGCFAAIVQGGKVSLVPTIGRGEYEAESCDKPTAVGILSSSGDVVRFGTVFGAFSPHATVSEPIVLNWSRSTGTLSIDAAWSSHASQAGAQTIAAMRRAVQ